LKRDKFDVVLDRILVPAAPLNVDKVKLSKANAPHEFCP